MALEQKLSLKLSQRLVMTPSLQQAIKLLQMTRLELEGVLSQELEENPVLEPGDETTEEDAEESASSDESEDETKSEDSDGDSQEAEAASEDEREEDPDDASMEDIDLDAYFNEYLENGESTASSTYEPREAVPIENTLTREPDLYDHLLGQLHTMDISPRQREIAELIIGNLDSDGFLVASVEEIQLLGATPEEVTAYREWQRRAALEIDEMDGEDADAPPPVDVAPSAALGSVEEDSQRPRPFPASGADDTAADDPAPTAPPSCQSIDSLAVVAAASAASSPPAVVLESRSKLESRGQVESREADEESSEAASAAPVDEPGEPSVPGYPRHEVESALELVRGLDPPGIACHDLRESLLLQLRIRGDDDTLTYRMIDEHWPRVLKRQFPAIAKKFGVPLAELEQPAYEIRSLETRPGRRFGGSGAHYVEPDVVVVKVGDEYAIQLNDDGMPRLRVSKAYRRMLQKLRAEGRQSEAQQYIKEKMRSAMWLIKSLDQRQRTIYKVADSIVKQQRTFLELGIEHLRPMVLRDVAEDIGMHESTVSRVVSNKYIHTPRGLFPMKFFFHSGIDRDYGGDISSLTVKRKIEKLVAAEDANKPLSDSELMRRLNAEGIKIARRTVAKYRDELNIPSSTDRKKVF